MKKKIIRMVMIGMIIPLLIAIFGSVSMVQNFQRKKMVAYKKQMKEEESAEQYITSANIPLSPLVENYRGQVLEAARKYGIEEYTDLMLAVMMQESGRACVDVFQCSESLGKPPNSIDTATSIDRACQIMSGYLRESGVGGIMDIIHIKLALQSYNFGGGFLKFVKENGGEWTQELTNEFARQKSNGVRNTGVRAERLGEWRYGDQHYTDHVLRYYPYMPSGDSAEISGIPLENRMSWLFPNGEPTSSTQMQEYLTTVSIPVIDTAGTESTAQLTVHKSIAVNVIGAFTELKNIGFPVRASDTSAYCWRNMVSGNKVSAHSYGVAIDVNWNSNPMIGYTSGNYKPGEDPYAVTTEVVNIFKKYGFYWGGDWSSSKDYMHFSYINK